MYRAAIWPALLTIVLFAPCLGGGFIYDDLPLLVETDRVVTATPHLAFTTEYTGFTQPKDWQYSVYRPLVVLTFSGLHRLFGLSPFAFHFVSMLMNAAATACFYWLLLALGQPRSVAMAATVLFAVHPLHVEPVAWVVGLAETQSGAFVLASLACFAYGKRGWSWLFAALAMFSKESALILPALIFVLACMYNGEPYRREPHNVAKRKRRAAVTAVLAAMPYALVAAVFVVIRTMVLTRPPQGAPARALLMALRQGPNVLAQFLKGLFWPWPLAVHYELAGRGVILEVLCGAALLVLVALRFKTLRDDLALCAALILLPLIIPVMTSPLRSQWLHVGDRLAYLSTTGACLLAAVLLARLPRRGLFYACMLLAPLGALGCYLQTEFWDNSEIFWKHTLQVTPASQPAALNLAYTLYLDERFIEAERVYREALRYHPNDKELLQSLAAMHGQHGVPSKPDR
jgi:tetratricopeptide (TPR) repeat protein